MREEDHAIHRQPPEDVLILQKNQEAAETGLQAKEE